MYRSVITSNDGVSPSISMSGRRTPGRARSIRRLARLGGDGKNADGSKAGKAGEDRTAGLRVSGRQAGSGYRNGEVRHGDISRLLVLF
jgi:hypothetical protein